MGFESKRAELGMKDKRDPPRFYKALVAVKHLSNDEIQEAQAIKNCNLEQEKRVYKRL